MAYKFKTGDKFYHTGIFAVAISPDKKSKMVGLCKPLYPVSTFNPPAGWTVVHVPSHDVIFCPQACVRGESDQDASPGYVSNPAEIGTHPKHSITGIVSVTPDPYGQGDVYLVDDGSHMTVPNIGWPHK